MRKLEILDKCLYWKHRLVIDDVKLGDAQTLVDEPSTGLLQFQTLKPAKYIKHHHVKVTSLVTHGRAE